MCAEKINTEEKDRSSQRILHEKSKNQPSNIHEILTELTLGKAKLEVENRKLKAEILNLSKNDDKHQDLYESVPVGIFLIDSNGIIEQVNPFGAKYLGKDQNALIRKPFSIYVNKEDLVIFFMHRKNLLGSKSPQTFMIRMHKADRETGYAQVTVSLSPGLHEKKPQMQVVLIDKTIERKSMDSLQRKNNILNFLFSIVNEVTALQDEQKTEAVIENLEILALILAVDRIFFVLFDPKEFKITDTFTWVNPIQSDKYEQTNASGFKGERALLKPLAEHGIFELSDIANDHRPASKKWISLFPEDVRSLFRVAVYDNQGRITGILGYETLTAPKKASEEEIGLLKIAAKLFYYAMGKVFGEACEEELEYKGPIEVIEDISPLVKPFDSPPVSIPVVRMDACTYDDARNKHVMRLYAHQENMMVSCPYCEKVESYRVSELMAIGKIIKMTCICLRESFIIMETRKYYRKPVNLFGFFIRKSPEAVRVRVKEKHQWGRIHIKNISKMGLGFELETDQEIHVNELLTIKFNLDNNTHSIIQKDVQVKSVSKKYVGCRFTSKDQNDVTLGFYMMSK